MAVNSYHEIVPLEKIVSPPCTFPTRRENKVEPAQLGIEHEAI